MKKKVALVLSGGGARGIAHIGAIEEIEKQGYEITSIAGTSMGALVGAIYATGKLQEYKEWLFSLDKFKILELIDFSLSKEGLVKGDRIFKKMKDFIPDIHIEDLPIQYSATSTDLLNKKEIVFTKGSILEAVRASVAIPTIITPVKKGNTILVDGGVVNNVPLNHVARTENDILVAIYVNAHTPVYKPKNIVTKENSKKKKTPYLEKILILKNELYKKHFKAKQTDLGYFNIINKTVDLLMYQLAMVAFEKYPPDILINVSRDSCGIFDFHKAKELVEIGRQMAIDSLKKHQN